MKKYIVFHIYVFHPTGGLGDVYNSFDELSEAEACMTNLENINGRHARSYIVDRDTWGIIKES